MPRAMPKDPRSGSSMPGPSRSPPGARRRGDRMRRRDLIAGVTTTLPLRALAQSSARLRVVGILMGIGRDDQEGQDRVAACRDRLAALGWSEGRNVSIDTRWTGGDA